MHQIWFASYTPSSLYDSAIHAPASLAVLVVLEYKLPLLVQLASLYF